MDARVARRVMELNQLIPRRTSRVLLEAIASGSNPQELPDGISEAQIRELQADYRRRARSLDRDTSPRNLAFYLMIKERFPDFNWTLNVTEQQQRNERDCSCVTVESPRVQGLAPSLASLLLGATSVHASQVGVIPCSYPELLHLPTVVQDIVDELFTELDLTLPDTSTMRAFTDWITRGLRGESLTALFPVCPDYAYERCSNLSRPFRYTFQSLGTGVGLVAQRALLSAPMLERILRKHGIHLRVVVGAGDFEALSEPTRQRLGVSFEEFLLRVRKSLDTFERECPIPVKTEMITDLCGGLSQWIDRCRATRTRLAQGDFGHAELSFGDLTRILVARQELYDRWHDRSDVGRARRLFDVLLDQGSEYATMGWIACHRLDNGFVVGCDHAVLSPFYKVEAPTEPLYLKPNY